MSEPTLIPVTAPHGCRRGWSPCAECLARFQAEDAQAAALRATTLEYAALAPVGFVPPREGV